MYISLWENSRGHPDNISFMQFSTKIDGFEQNDPQGFENSYNSYEQYPLENFFIFTIYQNYTLALSRLLVLHYIIFMCLIKLVFALSEIAYKIFSSQIIVLINVLIATEFRPY